MSELAIRLLGPFQVTLDNKTISHFETAKVRVLLAYLAAEAEQPQRREYLAEILWPDRPEGAARANLRHALGVLRSAIGDRGRSRGKPAQPPFLLVTRETIQINAAANIWVDMQAFTQLISKTSPAVRSPILRLEEAAALYRGSFLEDISIEDSVAIQEWILLKQEHLLYEVLNALSQLVRHYELLAEYKRALTYAWRHVELARWDEGAHRQVMRLLALAGMPGSALSHYETCRELLAEELDVEPGEATIELYEQIRDGQVVASSILSRHWQPEIEIPG
jgi:DNA-binding SARP family transcriptional activator